jgi:hypothetical protein
MTLYSFMASLGLNTAHNSLRAGFTVVGAPRAFKVWRPLSVTAILRHDGSLFVLLSYNNEEYTLNFRDFIEEMFQYNLWILDVFCGGSKGNRPSHCPIIWP